MSNPEIGKLLSFGCYEHDFSNWRVPRVQIKVIETTTKKLIYTELGRPDHVGENDVTNAILLAKTRSKEWNKLMEENGLDYRFSVKVRNDDGTNKRLEMIDNDNYFNKNLAEYINDVWNLFTSKTCFRSQRPLEFHFRREGVALENLQVFKKIYRWSVLDAWVNHPQIEELARRLERTMIRNKDKDFAEIAIRSGLLRKGFI